MNVLSIQALQVSFQTDSGSVPAVRGVDLVLAAGETLAVVGESGAGKAMRDPMQRITDKLRQIIREEMQAGKLAQAA